MALGGRPSERRRRLRVGLNSGETVDAFVCADCGAVVCPGCRDHAVRVVMIPGLWQCGCGWSGLVLVPEDVPFFSDDVDEDGLEVLH